MGQFVLLGVIAVLGLTGRGGWPESLHPGLLALGIALVVTGAVVVGLAATGLGSSLTALPAPLRDASLRTGGIYGLVRHPIYSGLILIATGWSVATSPWALLATAVLAVELDLKRRVEEKFLSATYPGYAAYRESVPRALVPGLW